MTVTVIIADDHEMTVTGMRLIIEAIPDFRVLAQTGSGLEVIGLCKRHQPDIVVLDIHEEPVVAEALQDLEARGAQVLYCRADVSSAEDRTAALAAAGYVFRVILL